VTDLMVLFPKINEKLTKKNAREILKSYAPMKRRISYDDSVYDLTQAIQYSDMPKNQSNRNGQENKMAKMFRYVSKDSMNYTRKINEIDLALKSLPDIHGKILQYSYCELNPYRVNEIAAKLKGYRINEFGKYEEFHYSVKNIEKLKAAALIQFAEAYKDGELLAFEK
jgi:ArpU family phage transcriptional regulator